MTLALSGTWYIVATTLPLWRQRRNPAVTYTPLPDGRTLDVVSYGTGERKLIVGIDTPDGDGLVWRGIGLVTGLMHSRWRFLDVGDLWAITHFERTLATPEGVDIYWRQPLPNPADLDDIRERLSLHLLGRSFTPALYLTDHA